MSEKRRDHRGRILHNGEIQLSDGRYRFKYVDEMGKERCVYSWRLDHNDATPKGKLRDYEYNEDLMKLYVMGGGAKMVEMFGKYNPDRTTFNHDICANAKGYEYFCYMMLRQKMRK